MKIDDEKWKAIIAETQAGIERQNASAAEHGCKDVFRCEVKEAGDYAILLTTHETKYDTKRKAVARELATGEVRSTKLVTKKGRLTSFTTKNSDPKAWAKLADKSAIDIVHALKLLDFLMFISSSITGVTVSK